MTAVKTMKKILPAVFSMLLLLFLSSCSPHIAGYTKGACITDPGTNTCRPVCSWELHYRLKDKKECMRVKYGCPRGEWVFGTWRGCGCAKPVFCIKN